MTRLRITTAVAIAAGLLLAACGGTSVTATSNPPTSSPTNPPMHHHSHTPQPDTGSPIPAESPVPAENNPPGDIPDNTQFVPYHSKAGGFTISIPEGWSRTTTKTSVTFTDKLNTVVVSWAPTGAAPTVSTANSKEIPVLRSTERAFRLGSVKSASLPAGQCVQIDYQANSEPDRVTGKQYRLDVIRYELFKGGTEVAIGLRSPIGSDNVDPWRIVTESFTWA